MKMLFPNAFPQMRNHTSAKKQCPMVRIKNDFHACRILEMPTVSNRRCQGTHHGIGIVQEHLDGQVDGFARNVGFIALHVDDNIRVIEFGSDFGNPIRPAWRVWMGHPNLSAELLDGIEDFFVIAGDDDRFRQCCIACGFVGMLDERLAGFGEEEFMRQPRRGIACRNDNDAFHRGIFYNKALRTSGACVPAFARPGLPIAPFMVKCRHTEIGKMKKSRRP